MGKFSQKLLNQLSEFLVCEIGSKAIDGITYTLLLKDNKVDNDTFKRYQQIRKEVMNCGYSSDEILRCYELSNGYIFDMDLSTAKQITFELSKAVSSMNGNKTPVGDLIGNSPEKRRKKDMGDLAKFVKESFDKGERECTVALFNKNATNKIRVTALDKNGNKLAIEYRAYAIRHWDIEAINSKLLMPNGIKIDSIQPCEILPHKTGVSFIFRFSEYYN